MEIKIGQYILYHSGTIIGVFGEPITFIIEDLTINLIFINDSEQLEQRIETVPNSEKEANLNFINFNNSLGIGNVLPMQIGFVNEKELFLNYRIYSLNDNAGKLVHYTWLLKQKGGNQ